MILIEHTVISDEIADKHFVCELSKCKGACCVEGDLGAPLEESEIADIERNMPSIMPYLSTEGKEVIEKEGFYVKDWEGDISTSTIGDRECVFAIYTPQHILKCGIEQAYQDKKSDFIKPISCHLYPIRVSKYGDSEVLNYERWSICAPACTHGEALKVPLYKFLKAPLIRKYGSSWYDFLVNEIENPQQH